jgi:hypothetical protein
MALLGHVSAEMTLRYARGRLSRGSHQRTPGIHRPPPPPAAQRGIPHPGRRGMGGIPRPLRAPQALPRRLRSGYGSSCIHEHSCIRCPLLRIGPAQRHRLQEICDSLTARIAEAEREGWTGEAEGLKVSLAAAKAKLAQADGFIARQAAIVSLGIPAYRNIAARTASGTRRGHNPRTADIDDRL